MSVEQADVVDAIGLDQDQNTVILSIIDALPWEDEHLLLLQNKINTYLGFIEGGELLSSYPQAEGKAVLIRLIVQHVPTPSALSFLEQVASITESAGISFEHQHQT